MSALPPEARAVLRVLLAHHDAGQGAPGIAALKRGARITGITAVHAAAYLERQGVYAVPTRRVRFHWTSRRVRHWRDWRRATLDVDAARALLGGGS